MRVRDDSMRACDAFVRARDAFVRARDDPMRARRYFLRFLARCRGRLSPWSCL